MKRKLFGLAAAAGMSLLALSGMASAQQAPYPPTNVGPGGAGRGVATQGGTSAPLPFTGSNSGELALIGVGAVAAGGALLAVSRRRRSVTPA